MRNSPYISSGDNEYIHLVNFLPFHEIFEITPGDNRNCTSKHLLNKKMTMRNFDQLLLLHSDDIIRT